MRMLKLTIGIGSLAGLAPMGIAVELKAGTPRDAVRLVKAGETQVGIGC